MSQVKRWQNEAINSGLKTRRVLLLSGIRQCGKTTLAKKQLAPDVTYRTLDDLTLLAAAKQDPHGFVEHNKKLLVIDEIQRVPELLPAIKKLVDENTEPGQFLITGSSNLQSSPGVTESLAGRIRKVRLRTFTQGELASTQPCFLDNACQQNFSDFSYKIKRQDIINLALKGGYPEVMSFNDKERGLWHKDYLSALLERDLADIVNIRRLDIMEEFTKILAAWSSKYMDLSALGSKLSLKRDTLEIYINALSALYLYDRVPAWIKTDYERVGKKSKLFATDSGIMASTLNWHMKDINFDVDRVGKLIETFVYTELASQVDAADGDFTLYHYRDREKREIDFIIERNDGYLLGIEVKAGSTLKKEHFKHLQWFKENLVKENRNFVGIVLYTGNQVSSFGKDMWGVPISILWGK